MKSKAILVGAVIIFAGVLGYFGYQYFTDSNEVKNKLEEASFVLTDDYYVRDVLQDEITYEEIMAVETNEFIRISNISSEREVYSYNYDEETFKYLYYFDEELIMTLSYDYKEEKVIEDEDSIYDALEDDILSLEVYFNGILTDYDLEIEEL